MILGGHRPVQQKKPFMRGALCALSVLSASVGGIALAEPQATVPLALSVRQELAGQETRLIFAVGACVATDSHVLENPARAIVDMPEVNFQIDPQVGRNPAERGRRHAHRSAAAASAAAGSPGGGLIVSYRFGKLAPGKSRIVVDLAGPAEIATRCTPATDAGFDLTLALTPQNDAAFRTAARAGAEMQTLKTSQATPATPPPRPSNPAGAEKPVVVLDPGHGGVDTGALGRDHAVEKFVVLEFAKILGAGFREGDRYLRRFHPRGRHLCTARRARKTRPQPRRRAFRFVCMPTRWPATAPAFRAPPSTPCPTAPPTPRPPASPSTKTRPTRRPASRRRRTPAMSTTFCLT